MTARAPHKRGDEHLLASLDPNFLMGDSTRGIRFYVEYERPEERLQAWGIASTIVVIGSARVGHKSEPNCHPNSIRLPTKKSSQCGEWYEQARRFARIASERGGCRRLSQQCNCHGRRSWNYGSRKQGRFRSRRAVDWVQHQASTRATPE